MNHSEKQSAQQSLDIFRFDKFNKLRFITEGMGTISDLLDDNSGESVPRHPLTDRQCAGLIFALKGLVGGLEDCVDELDCMMDVVGKALATDEACGVGRSAS